MTPVDRRQWLKFLLAGSATAVFPFGNVASALAGRGAELLEPASGPAPTWLLNPLKPGSEVGFGWRIVSLSDVERGAAVLTLSRDASLLSGGEPLEARIHMCATGDTPRGMASTDLLDFIWMNGSRGETPSDEHLGRVVRVIASHVQANERLASAELLAAASLMPHEERERLFGGETLV